MNTKTLALGLCLALATTAGAQNKQGGISAEMLQNIEKTQKATTTADKALFNALASNKIDDLAKNFGNNRYTNDHFSVETAKQSIHNQKSSGRCWMFSSFNVLRSDFAHNHGDSVVVDFSHVYLFFFDQLEKANLMLQGVIDNAKKPIDDQRVQFFFKNPLNDGGTFCGAADLAPKYGLVPMSVQPETFSAENTSKISSLISTKLREFGLELRKMVADGKKAAAINQRNTEMLGTVYHMLSITMGEPVKEFTYQFRNKDGKAVGEPRRFTPKSFYDEVGGHPLEGTFIMVMNDPRRPYHKTYEVEYDRHVYDGQNWKYLNLPVEDIAKLAIASLKDGKKMYSSYDVGKQLDRTSGYLDTENFDYGSLFSTSFNKMNKAERIATFDSGSTHAMTLTAVDLDKDGNPIKWKVENSWGANNGVNGCLIMTNRWFNEYMFRLVVDKKYVPETLLKEFDQKPLMVMPEDPLFGQDD